MDQRVTIEEMFKISELAEMYIVENHQRRTEFKETIPSCNGILVTQYNDSDGIKCEPLSRNNDTSCTGTNLILPAQRKLTCNFCLRVFATKRSITKHIMKHVSNDPYQCLYCQAGFVTNSELCEHTKLHIKERPHVCNHCHKNFTTKFFLEKHATIHNSKRLLPKCNYCAKEFATKGDLIKHIRIHTGEKPYVCTMCTKRYRQKTHLKSHIRVVHIGEKPFKCYYCEQTFCYKNVLKLHIRVHTGDTIDCPICGQQFYRQNRLNNHLSSKHAIIVRKDNNKVCHSSTTSNYPDKTLHGNNFSSLNFLK